MFAYSVPFFAFPADPKGRGVVSPARQDLLEIYYKTEKETENEAKDISIVICPAGTMYGAGIVAGDGMGGNACLWHMRRKPYVDTRRRWKADHQWNRSNDGL